jgi:hypothetical protein
MILPRAAPTYDQSNEQLARDALTREDMVIFKSGKDVELARGEHLILRSPNGSRWALSASNAGVLTLVAA